MITYSSAFKNNSSCNHALFTLHESVKYLTKSRAKVCSALLDASKAFDKVLHSGLFKKLLGKRVSCLVLWQINIVVVIEKLIWSLVLFS